MLQEEDDEFPLTDDDKHIAEVSGHSEKDTETIIRKHYLVSSAAVEKIESRTIAVNRAQSGKLEE
ncbi:hypothetical protein [Ochrobactrum sp. Marseille-Q0166]|uniref:hypothetical protein n=1 Tax=Ochrobactrum sp. Marseille-Q0166 TaxID=2761105 RepID=UPI001655C2AF|nr:hypothetical protein [Ochrobactrum sp. Marseille-Q0166]MBC8718405.1 hypothetical protein [Ochrobactrum sp. Marseille-Q0166]